MVLLDFRQRTGWLFVAVLIGHIILISAQVTTRRGVPLLEEATFGVFAELQRVATNGIGGVRGFWGNYVGLRQVRAENEQLREELAQLRVQVQEERALAQEARVLRDALALRKATSQPLAAASVIAGSASPDFRTLTIDKGTADGLQADMAVISPSGVVGRVIMPGTRASKVQLLIDRNAAVGVLVERSRAQGVVVGTGTDRMRMLYVSGSADITTGDMVVTSGIDGIYPKGFVVGQIESIQRGSSEYGTILVRPAVEFTALETVLVALGAPGFADQEGQ
jgi:rod shape-determining protein MreC